MKPTRKALAAATLTVLACAAPAAALPRLTSLGYGVLMFDTVVACCWSPAQ